jgi:thioredoxin reductase (NADPH)
MGGVDLTLPNDPSDPYRREAQTFPKLSADQIERIKGFGEVEEVKQGTMLFRRGERSVDFFVVIEGAVEILDSGAPGEEAVIHLHRDRQFTGELDLFNNREILVGGRAGRDSRIIRVPRANFHRLIEAEPDIGEVVIRAFILRRVGLMKYAQGGVVLIGSMHCADTMRIESFLTRNGYPHRRIDTEIDPDAEGLLQSLGLGSDALPVVMLPDHEALRRPSTHKLADALGLTERLDPDKVYDLAVVGAGPAGLAAAVYGASEGLETVVIEALAPGGQAGTSSKIENYLGFPPAFPGRRWPGARRCRRRSSARGSQSRARRRRSTATDRLIAWSWKTGSGCRPAAS